MKIEKSVLGFEKSTFNFKENTWDINPDEKKTDKVTFDLKRMNLILVSLN